MRHVLILLSCLLLSDAFMQAVSPTVMMYFPFNGAARLVRTVRFMRYLMRMRTVLRRDDKISRLEVIQKEISSLFFEDKNTHFEFETDFEAAESYRDSYLELKTKVEASLKSSRGLMKCSSTDNAPKLKLPKFEFKKFSGDPKEFLTFWSIFSKIHESDDLTEVDKFQYLYQCMVPESRAARLISSFPITTENYSKAIQQLKARFGREELLDSASSRSYVSDRVVDYLRLQPLKHEKVIHEDPQILQILRVNNIELSDVTCNEIDLLIGADLIGKLLTGRSVQLNFGLTAIHTKLGWTVIGKETGLYSGDDYPIMDSVQTVLSLYVNNASLRELWDIESLGIREPIENVSKRKAFDEQLKEFHEKLTVLPEIRGRITLEIRCKNELAR
ncbi:hypothetical protein AVEN_47287-1 [Araneus ventricosus]|uniref:Peptidase aspartic putative domain-containing protein n=1 Tax=Araneus ventricosus TaxID=182803 RepID=A0A4Y2UEA0_ARAVE|nr:hypothetical protein AVEN_47287-1 [Araneus ventricosus]